MDMSKSMDDWNLFLKAYWGKTVRDRIKLIPSDSTAVAWRVWHDKSDGDGWMRICSADELKCLAGNLDMARESLNTIRSMAANDSDIQREAMETLRELDRGLPVRYSRK
jgi:hypothetical protein